VIRSGWSGFVWEAEGVADAVEEAGTGRGGWNDCGGYFETHQHCLPMLKLVQIGQLSGKAGKTQ
jgi:hypothetical protein